MGLNSYTQFLQGITISKTIPVHSYASLLKFGAGPYIHTLISVASDVDQIYHSDQCCNEALLWKNNDPKVYNNWSPYFQFFSYSAV